MGKLRKKIYSIIEVSETGNGLSRFYDIFLMVIICLSLAPLTVKESGAFFDYIDYVCVSVFVIDYLLRLITADLRLNKGVKSFFIYPFTFYALIDLISILPSFNIMNSYFKVLKMLRFFRCLRIFKVFRFSKNFDLLITVISSQKKILISILSIAAMYILFTALVMFNVEPDTFDTFFDSLYWAVTALTTVGYGDVYPLTTAGRVVSMLSSLFGVAMIALPSGVITASFMEEVNKDREEKIEKNE